MHACGGLLTEIPSPLVFLFVPARLFSALFPSSSALTASPLALLIQARLSSKLFALDAPF